MAEGTEKPCGRLGAASICGCAEHVTYLCARECLSGLGFTNRGAHQLGQLHDVAGHPGLGKLLGSCLKKEAVAETFINSTVSKLFPVAWPTVEMGEHSQELLY